MSVMPFIAYRCMTTPWSLHSRFQVPFIQFTSDSHQWLMTNSFIYISYHSLSPHKLQSSQVTCTAQTSCIHCVYWEHWQWLTRYLICTAMTTPLSRIVTFNYHFTLFGRRPTGYNCTMRVHGTAHLTCSCLQAT